MQLADVELPGITDADRERHRVQLAASAGATATSRCESTFDRHQLDCVMAATSSATAYACTASSGTTVAQSSGVQP
jgi:hypothetical protein